MFSSLQQQSNSLPARQGGCKWTAQQGSLSHPPRASVRWWQALGAQLLAARNNGSSYSKEAQQCSCAGCAGMFKAGDQRARARDEVMRWPQDPEGPASPLAQARASSGLVCSAPLVKPEHKGQALQDQWMMADKHRQGINSEPWPKFVQNHKANTRFSTSNSSFRDSS